MSSWADEEDEKPAAVPAAWGVPAAAPAAAPAVNAQEFPSVGEAKKKPAKKPQPQAAPRESAAPRRDGGDYPPRRDDYREERGPRDDYHDDFRRRDDRRDGGYGRRDFHDERREYDRPPRDDRAPREDRPQKPVPENPPYVAFVGNLSFQCTEDDLGKFFEDNGAKPFSVKIVMRNERPAGFGYVDFAEDVEALKKALALNNTDMMGRQLRTDVADGPSAMGSRRDRDPRDSQWGPRRDRDSQWGPRRGGFGGGFGDRDREGGFGDRDGEEREHEGARGGRPAFYRDDRGPLPEGDDRNRRGGHGPRRLAAMPGEEDFRSPREEHEREPERAPAPARKEAEAEAPRAPAPADAAAPEHHERKKLQLKPRTVDAPVGAPIAPASTKSNPFGGARPRDEAEYERRKAAERQKAEEAAAKEKEAKAAEAPKDAAPAAEKEEAAAPAAAAAAPAEAKPVEAAAAPAEAKPAEAAAAAPKEDAAAKSSSPKGSRETKNPWGKKAPAATAAQGEKKKKKKVVNPYAGLPEEEA